MNPELFERAKQGRHRYFRIVDSDIANQIEKIMGLSGLTRNNTAVMNKDRGELALARTCYDHLAGNYAVTFFDLLMKNKLIVRSDESMNLTGDGKKWFEDIGFDISSLKNQRRTFCSACLDWTERKDHLAGALGAHLLVFLEDNGWIKRSPISRNLLVTNEGKRFLLTMTL